MQGKVEICGVNTSRLKTLSHAQMDELLLRAKDGDENARQALIERQSPAGIECDPAFRQAGRKSRRPVSSGLHRFDESHFQFRSHQASPFLHLRRANDCRK